MSSGLYSITTRASGTILTAAIYNADHQNHVTNQNPSMTGAYSDDTTQMQAQTDPGGLGTENLAGSLAGELERIRFVLAAMLGNTYWYEAPATTLLAAASAASPTNHYDLSFNAGLQSDGTFANVAVQIYAEIVIGRALTLTGEKLYMVTPPTGQAAIFDILKNGTTIYSVKPQCAASTNAGTAGTLSVTSVAAGDRLTFTCTQVGSGTIGSGALFTLLGHE